MAPSATTINPATLWVRTPWQQTLAVPLTDDSSTATLAAAVAARTDIPPDELHLHWGGKPLVSTESGGVSLATLGVGPGATVELLVRIRGGAKLGKEVKGKVRHLSTLEFIDLMLMSISPLGTLSLHFCHASPLRTWPLQSVESVPC